MSKKVELVWQSPKVTPMYVPLLGLSACTCNSPASANQLSLLTRFALNRNTQLLRSFFFSRILRFHFWLTLSKKRGSTPSRLDRIPYVSIKKIAQNSSKKNFIQKNFHREHRPHRMVFKCRSYALDRCSLAYLHIISFLPIPSVSFIFLCSHHYSFVLCPRLSLSFLSLFFQHRLSRLSPVSWKDRGETFPCLNFLKNLSIRLRPSQ